VDTSNVGLASWRSPISRSKRQLSKLEENYRSLGLLKMDFSMSKNISFVLFLSLFSVGCSSSRKSLSQPLKGNPIQIAIGEFSEKCKLYKQSSTFYVKLLNPKEYSDMVVVSIVKSGTKMLLKPDATIGSKGKLPFRYYEKDGKLFFWKDEDYVLTEDALAVYRRYNVVQEDSDNKIGIPDPLTNDKQKGATYFFCKNNPAIYKRIVSSIAVGEYDPPVLKCQK